MLARFPNKSGSGESLKCRWRCGARPGAFQVAYTVEQPAAFATLASARSVQRIASRTLTRHVENLQRALLNRLRWWATIVMASFAISVRMPALVGPSA